MEALWKAFHACVKKGSVMATGRAVWLKLSLHLNWRWNNTWVGRTVLTVLKVLFEYVTSWMSILKGGNQSWNDWSCISAGCMTAGSGSCYVSKIFFMTFFILPILPPGVSAAQLESFFRYEADWLLLMALHSLVWLKRPVSLLQRSEPPATFTLIKRENCQLVEMLSVPENQSH